LNLDWYFRRRVARWQETKPPGSTITADDVSYLSNINTSRLRLRADFNYWENVDEWASVGIRTEGGWSVSLARKRQPTVFLDETQSTEALGSMGHEFTTFFVEEDVNLNENESTSPWDRWRLWWTGQLRVLATASPLPSRRPCIGMSTPAL
jgi:hypothetical protein